MKRGTIETVVIAAPPEAITLAPPRGFRVEVATPHSVVLASTSDGTRAYLALARVEGGTRVAIVHAGDASPWRAYLASLHLAA
jgi:hypothetical protein